MRQLGDDRALPANPSRVAHIKSHCTDGTLVLRPNLPRPLQITTHEGVIGYLDNYEYFSYWSMFIHNGSYGSGVLYAKPQRTVVLNTTAPVMKESGQARCG